MSKISLIFVSLLTLYVSIAQPVDLVKQFKSLKARSIGPAGMSGRVTAIDAVNSNPNIIYIGAASGGVWKTENAGTTWKPVFDDQPTQNIGAIAIQQNNPSVVWVGTGEGNPRNSINIGEGIFKTLDGGKTWKRMGLEKTRNIHRILIDPGNPNTIYVAAIGNPFGVHPERGVFKTTDGGETWKRILYVNDTTGAGELVMDPTNPNKLVANLWQHKRTPWSFTSGGPGSGLYITWDGGKNWKKMGKEEGIPDSTGRIGLAISPSDPKVIYALFESKKNALYRSEDGGFNFLKVNDSPEWVTNRPFYFQDIRVDPVNENRLYNINMTVSVSEDGGKSFKIIIPYSGVHPDHHAWWINPLDGNYIIDGNDGGIDISRDRGRSWQFDEKLPLGQFYHVNVDNEIPYHVMGGLQDNGSWRGPAYVWAEGGIRNSLWQDVGSGDGFDVSADPDDANWVYSMSQGGSLSRFNASTGENWYIKPSMSDTTNRIRFNWNAAFAQDPFDHNTIYYGSQFVHKSINKGAGWTIISPDLTTNNKDKQKQDENGRLTIDITNAENHCTITTIEPSPLERNLIWVGTDDGNIQLTKDCGSTWTNITPNIPGLPKTSWIPQIKSSRHNTGEAFVVANNYRLGDFSAYIFRTADYGKSWTRVVDDSKVRGYALCMIQDPQEPDLVFVGTENGLWISFDNCASFQQFRNNYPSVSTYDLAIQEREGDLVIATFGRALFVIDDIMPLRKLASAKGQIPAKPVTVFSSPVAYNSFVNAPSGIEWSSWGLFAAENRKIGATINFYITARADTSKAIDSASIKIFDAKNGLVRSYKEKTDTGFTRVYWNFSTKGYRRPGSAKTKKDGNEPGNGLPAEPGDYKVVVSLNGKDSTAMDSTIITIKYDPRSQFPASVFAVQKSLYNRIVTASNRMVQAFDALSEDEETIKKLDAQLKDVESNAADSLRKMSKAMQDSIQNIRDYTSGKKQNKQGYGEPYQVTATGRLDEAMRLVINKGTMPGAQEEMAIKIAEDLVQKSIDRVNHFHISTWSKFKQLAQSEPAHIFKDQVTL